MFDLSTLNFGDGLKFYLPLKSQMHKFIASGKVWEPEVTRFLKSNLRPHSIFVDVGAQLGYYTLLASERCKLVYSFEPRIEQFTILVHNVVQNERNNVVTASLPLFSSSSLLNLNSNDATTLPLENVVEPDERTEALLRATTLDEFLLGRPVDFIKIDTEGAEYDILLGAVETLKSCSPVLIIEIHAKMFKRFGYGKEQLLQLLKNLGYSWQSISLQHIVAEYSGGAQDD